MARRTRKSDSTAPAEEATSAAATKNTPTEPVIPDAQTTTETTVAEGELTSQEQTERRTRAPAKRGRVAGRQQRAARSQTSAVVEALLKSRAAGGATQEDLQRAVSWAQQVQAEGKAIEQQSVPRRSPRGAKTTPLTPRARALQARQREQQQEQLKERRARFELDRALLDGVVAGRIGLDVQEGQLLFLSAEGATSLTSPPARTGAGAAPDAY